MHLSFKQNTGTVDRILRIILGAILIYLAAFQPLNLSTFWNIALWILGLAFIIEGAIGY
ncbi:MAG: DUF2892 domain-containing protein [Syntrophomonadaceae bacterium]|nr:DUF2892 domain-containing protein [Syntrophomonadaceae bacterium]MDD3888871.1 DUF2892 domain-containing protein [Syntrophomonadaceae bacterium]MDD4549011.1 DUF2892 domain-containing protein [Syntrophomonadaceae bacterium]